jgi:uncharacterized repeat protein (TIGR02543 family)
LTTGYGTTVTATPSPVTGTSSTPVSKAISGLTSNTTYHFRVGGNNSAGTSYGTDVTFTTLNPTYTITYDANTSSGGSVPTDANTYTLAATVTVLANTGSLVKTGYTFAGWNTVANGTGTSYPATGSATFAMGTANVTLYAQWTLNNYTITFDKNDGDATGTMSNQTIACGASANLTANGFTKAGWTFTGWATTPGGTVAYADGASYTMGTSNVTLYAKWAVNNYTITFDKNDVAATGTMSTQTIASGSSAALTANAFTKTGWTFSGWATTSGGSVAYANGASYTMGTANVTLYAQWTLIPTYTVTYDGNTSTGGTVPAGVNTYVQSATVTVLGNTGNLVKTGYTFAGWNTAANGTGTSYAASGSASFAMGTANVTLYAQWTLNNYTITFDKNDGDATGTMSNQAIAYGASANLTANGFTKAGWTFGGWATTPGGTVAYADGASYPMGASSITLYAKWTANNYTVTFDKNDGSATGTMSMQTIASGASAALTANAFAKAGWTFSGWSTTSSGSVAYANSANYTMGTANVILYAQWTLIPTYTVTYDGNTKTSGSIPVDANTYAQSATVTVLGNTGSLVKTGYTFAGWNTAAGGGGTGYAATGSATFAMGTANVMLYAQWTLIPTYTVVYDGNTSTGGTVPTDGNNYVQASSVTVLANTGTLVKSGYDFAGWNTAANGSGSSYAASGSVTFAMGTANVTLYAQWTAIPSHTILPTTYAIQFNGIYGTASTVKYALPEASSVSIKLFDFRGKTVKNLYTGSQPAGYHQLIPDISALSKGCYILEFKAGSHVIKKRIMNY